MKLEPTLNIAELTRVLTLAKPVIVVLPAANVVMPDAAPAKVSDVIDKAELTCAPTEFTVSVEPPRTDIVPVEVIVPPLRPFAAATLVTPVAAGATQYAAVPFDERTCPAEPNPPFAERPDEPRTTLPENVVTPPTCSVLPTLAKPVVVIPVELAMKLVPTVNEAVLILVLTLAKPVMVVLPAANVVMPDAAPPSVRELKVPTEVREDATIPVPKAVELAIVVLPIL